VKLQHKIANGETKDIRITNGLPIRVRYKSKVLGELWQKFKARLTNLPQDIRPEPIELSNSNGGLYLILGSRTTDLFETSIDPTGNMHVTAKSTNLDPYKITSELSDAWVVDAVAVASGFVPK
jgi:hypothetical protein